VRTSYIKAGVLGVLGGTFVSVLAYERILGPLRPLPAIRHTDRNCLFNRRAWIAAAGLVHTQAVLPRNSARERMAGDLNDHHVCRGMSKAQVQELLGWPDVIERPDTWSYSLAPGRDIVINFNLWGNVATTSFRLPCPAIASTDHAPVVGDAALAAQR